MNNYPAFYEKHTAFLRRLAKPDRLLSVLDKVVTGAIALLYATGVVLAAFQVFGAYLPTLLALCVPPASSLVVVLLLRLLIKRKRPYLADTPIHPICKKEKDSPSFPSRHTVSAFSIGVSLCILSPTALWLGIPVLALGMALGYLRFLCGYHYPSDLLGGAGIGAAIGAIAFLF